MARVKKNPAEYRGGGIRNRHGSSDDTNRWEQENPDDDPLRDLRPEEEDPRNPANDEYIWPDMHDENEDDD